MSAKEIVHTMGELHGQARADGWRPVWFAVSPPVLEAIAPIIAPPATRPSRYLGTELREHDEWSWGWMLFALPPGDFARAKPFSRDDVPTELEKTQ